MTAAQSLQNIISPQSVRIAGVDMHYLVVGNGSKLALAFHGYGQNAAVFSFLMQNDYTVLSFDLPYQGNTIVDGYCTLEKKDVCTLVKHLMKQYNVDRVSLLGFSMGARLCLCVTEHMPDVVRNLVLVAPDGIRPNYFYKFLTNNFLGRFCFRGFVRFGALYLKVFAFLHFVGLLDRTMYKFVLQYVRTPDSRILLYKIWYSMRKLIPNLNRLKKNIHKRGIPVHLMMGQQDLVIPVRNAFHFKGKTPDIKIHVFERGHNLLDFEEVQGSVASWLFRSSSNPKSKF